MRIVVNYLALLTSFGVVSATPLVTQYGAIQSVVPARMDMVKEVDRFAINTSKATTKGEVSGAFPNRKGTFLSFKKLDPMRTYSLVLLNPATFAGAIDVYHVPESFTFVPRRTDGTIAWIKLGTIYSPGELFSDPISDVARGKSSVTLFLAPSLQYNSTLVKWTENANPVRGFALKSIMATPVKRYVSKGGGNYVVPRNLVVLTGLDHFRIAGKSAVQRGTVTGPSPWSVGVLASFVLVTHGSYNLVLIKPDVALGRVSVYQVPEDFGGATVPLINGLPAWKRIGTLEPRKGGRSKALRNAAESVSTARFLLLPEYQAADTTHVVQVEWADNFAKRTGLILENTKQVD